MTITRFCVIKVRDKIVADGLNDETFDVTNIGVHLKAKFNEILDNQTQLWLILEIITVKSATLKEPLHQMWILFMSHYYQ
jgi:hypothetical protein